MSRRWIGLAAVACCLLLPACNEQDEKDTVCTPPYAPARCTYACDYDERPSLLSMTPPVYPEEARQAGDEGVVHVCVGVGTDSVPCGVRLISSEATSLEMAALEAALTSRWRPARHDGEYVALEVDLTIRFSLNAPPEALPASIRPLCPRTEP